MQIVHIPTGITVQGKTKKSQFRLRESLIKLIEDKLNESIYD